MLEVQGVLMLQFIEAPIQYANANCPESAFYSAKIAAYNINLTKIFSFALSGRRLGHNESDDPNDTTVNGTNKSHEPVLSLYTKQLIATTHSQKKNLMS